MILIHFGHFVLFDFQLTEIVTWKYFHFKMKDKLIKFRDFETLFLTEQILRKNVGEKAIKVKSVRSFFKLDSLSRSWKFYAMTSIDITMLLLI